MSIEFRIGRTDHHKIEEFLAAGPTGVGAVRVDAKNLTIHRDAIAAARAVDAEVYVEPLTERFLVAGFNPAGIAYGDRYLLDVGALMNDRADQTRFTEEVIAPQLDVATAITPPHFFVEHPELLDLNVGLVRQAVALVGADRPVRPILSVGSMFLRDHAGQIADRYTAAGVAAIELRVSPLGGDGVGPVAVRRAFAALEELRARRLTVTLGMAGPVGLAALALGLVAGVSTGIGYREQYDYKSAMSSQRPSAGDVDEPDGGGNPARVLLPGADVLVTRVVARHLYSIPAVRSQLMCRVGRCGHTLDGPVADLRGHYLHSRTEQVVDILRQPAAWRPMGLHAHLVRAHELRAQLVQHLPAGANPIKNRTFETLISELERRAPQRRTA